MKSKMHTSTHPAEDTSGKDQQSTNHTKGQTKEGEPLPAIDIRGHFCVTDDLEHLVPKRKRTPRFLPPAAIPAVNTYVQLSSRSMWRVVRHVQEWRNAHELRIQVWIEYEGPTHHAGRADFELTQ